MKNKFLRGVTTLSIAAAICMACGVVTASAAEGDDETPALNTLELADVSVDYETQEIKVDLSQGEGTSADKQILFGVSSVVKKTGVLKTAAWEVYDAYSVVKGEDGNPDTEQLKTVVIDISSLNTQKDNYVQIKGDQSSDPITLYIPATEKKIKAKFNPGKRKIENNKGADGSDKLALEYRTLYGEWSDLGTLEAPLGDVDLSMYQQRGATLYIRQKSTGIVATEDGVFTTMSPSNPDEDGNGGNLISESKVEVKDADGNALKAVYKLGSLPGKEIKVAVSKKANGPKIAINYQKGTVTIPKNAMWRVNGNVADTVAEGDPQTYTWTMGTFKAAGTGKYVLEGNEAAPLFNGGNVEAYTKSTNDNKADSKITHIDLTNKRETLTPAETNNPDNVSGNKIGDVVANVSGTNGKYTLEVTNNSKVDKYQVIVNDSATEAGTTGVKTIAPGKTYKQKNIADGKYVWISKVGDAKSQTWSTAYTLLGKVVAKEESEDQKALNAFADYAEKNAVAAFACGGNVGTEVTVFNLNESVAWGSPETYTYGDDGKEIKDVTITATEVESASGYIKISGSSVAVGKKATAAVSETTKVTVTFEKKDCSKVTKVISATISK